MDRATVRVYEERGAEWAAQRSPVRRDDAIAFGRAVRPGGLRLDVGAGAGRYTNELGRPVVALDAARTMLELLRGVAGHALAVQADLERLPFAPRAFAGAWANMCYQHVPRVAVPMALADLHHAMEVGGLLDVQVLHGDNDGHDLPGDDVGGRFFAGWRAQQLADVLTGAGFAVDGGDDGDDGVVVDGDVVRARCLRARTLADTVGPGMRVLVCGLNPSVYSADRGVGFARPTNRFWKAAIEAGLVSRARDARHALVAHGVGMTDLCKRATVSSRELSRAEYVAGAARVRRLVEWLQPGVVVFVGLEGWRKAIDPAASPGLQSHAGFGDRPAYVMPSTSGANARTSLAELVTYLRAAMAVAPA
jgi:TDG/mug DNA glycosylase family protein